MTKEYKYYFEVTRCSWRNNAEPVDLYFGCSRKEAFKIFRKKRAKLKSGTVMLRRNGTVKAWDRVMG